MAYTDFTLEDLQKKFKVQNKKGRLFPTLKAIKPSEHLKRDLQDAQNLPKRTEKAKSELVVAPILREIWRKNNPYFTIYSGELLNADTSVGLNGECDFILAKDIGSYSINYPILHVVEAKKHDLDLGIPQCAAQMLGAKIFNQKMETEVERIYGCVTTGEDWLFMTLENDFLIDDKIYHLNKLSEVLAVFQYIIDYYKNTLK
jgi:hypothetical protein